MLQCIYSVMKIFDSHAHISLIYDDLVSQRLVATESYAKGVRKIINICNNLQDFLPVYNNLIHTKNVFFAVGISPSEVSSLQSNWMQNLQSFLKKERVCAIGETGLDKKYGNRNIQVEFFIKHIEIAEKFSLPIIIHNRGAGADILEIVAQMRPQVPVIFHCFSEDLKFARRILEIQPNSFLSFTGSLTYKTARALREVATSIPAENIILESESPFMPPSNVRDKRNKPFFLTHTLTSLAELREVDVESFAEQIYNNSLRAFKLTDSE